MNKVWAQWVLDTRNAMRRNKGRLANDSHWEKLEGEIFLQNMAPEQFELLPLRTKRMGEVALTSGGETYESMYGDKKTKPVFVQKYELAELGVRYEYPVELLNKKPPG